MMTMAIMVVVMIMMRRVVDYRRPRLWKEIERKRHE